MANLGAAAHPKKLGGCTQARQTDRMTDRQTDRQRDKRAVRQTEITNVTQLEEMNC